MYKPTEQELLEMGFESSKIYKQSELGVTWYRFNPDEDLRILYSMLLDNWYITDRWAENGGLIFPSSKQDIETLIRLFSKP